METGLTGDRKRASQTIGSIRERGRTMKTFALPFVTSILAACLGCGDAPQAEDAVAPSPPAVSPVPRAKAEYSAAAGARDAEPGLLEQIQDKDEKVRNAALEKLASRPPDSPDLVFGLVDLLRNKDEEIRGSARSAFKELGSKAKNALPRLVELLAEKDAAVREAAAASLGFLGREAASAVPVLVGALRDGNASVRSAAAQRWE